MAADYTVYQNLYNSVNHLLYQLQMLGVGAQTSGSLYSGRVDSSSQSFADTFQNAAQRLSVPESMDSIFEEAAKRYNVPVNLLMAVGKAESGFNENAVSAAGAQGVMQLMPSTAAYLGVDNAFDARSNIMGGAKYLSQKLEQYNGDIDLALAAYNAGSGNVEKYGGVPPFEETINYIRRIRQYMGEDLSTGRSVQTAGTQRAASNLTAGRAVSGTGRSVSGLDTARASGTKGTSSGTGTDFTQEVAEYFVSMMRLQMMSRVGSLGRSSFMDTDSDTYSYWL